MYYGETLAFGSIVLGIILVVLVGVASNIMLALCVYYDAKFRRNENAVLWAVLSGFFGVAALVYIIIAVTTKQKSLRCTQCGEFLMPNSSFCPRCGRAVYVLSPEDSDKYNKRRKLFLGLWIGCLVLTFIFSFLFTGIFVSQMFMM